MSTSLSITRGSTGRWSAVISDLDGVAIDLTGCSLRMALWATRPAATIADDDDADLVLSSPSDGIQITSEEDGEIEITITDTQSALLTRPAYAFDLRLTNSIDEVFTAASGLLTISDRITHAA